jgi:hypothetical protein
VGGYFPQRDLPADEVEDDEANDNVDLSVIFDPPIPPAVWISDQSHKEDQSVQILNHPA